MERSAIPKWALYVALAILSVVVLYLFSLFQQVPEAKQGEYYYSQLVRFNYSVWVQMIFIVVAFLAGYVFRLNPFLTGACLYWIFPMTAVYEATVYKGSHNLIPFEFATHILMAVPAIVSVYLGRYAYTKLRGESQQ